MNSNTEVTELAENLEKKLIEQYGSQLVSGEELMQALGYRSIHALYQAQNRKQLPVHTFSIPNRKGTFALVKDIAFWLAELRLENQQTLKEKNDLKIKS